jgi:DNA-binding PadR family transcriptional regulator
MWEFMILAQLSRRPMHGYLIAKIFGYVMGPYRQVQWGTLYPVLSRLESDGLIRAEDAQGDGDARARKVYSITDAGRLRLREHLLDTERHLGEYNSVFELKVPLFYQLSPEERLQLSRHYQVYTQRHIDHLERNCSSLEVEAAHLSTEQLDGIRTVMNHRLEHWKRERAWAEELIERSRLKEAM